MMTFCCFFLVLYLILATQEVASYLIAPQMVQKMIYEYVFSWTTEVWMSKFNLFGGQLIDG